MVKLSISNIIWAKGRAAFPEFLDAAVEQGLHGVELALNALFEEPATLTDGEVLALRQEIVGRGLVVSALHSLTFTRPDLELFGAAEKREGLRAYLLEYIRIARLLQCSNLVLGSPSARKMHGKSKAECDGIFLSFLAGLDGYLEGVFLNVEPLHPGMCEYLHTLQETGRLLTDVGLSNIRVQLDLRACIENEEGLEQIRQSLPRVTHCQVSDPGLTPLGDGYARQHEQFASLLREARYSGFIAAEMLCPKGLGNKNAMGLAVRSLKRFYGA